MTPFFSIVIPVLNEVQGISRTLTHLLRQCPDGELEVIVVDGDPDGSTLAAIRTNGVLKSTAPAGRASQMNHGAAMSSGEVLLFLHADTHLPEGWPSDVRRVVLAEHCMAGAFDLGIDSPAPAYRLIEVMVYWRTRITKIPYGDQSIFIRRDAFSQLGGFSQMPLMEDVELMRRVKRSRGRIGVIGKQVLTSARRWEKEGVVFCTLRNWLLVSLFFLGVPPQKLVRYYSFKGPSMRRYEL